jgi:1-acyl-sn-glycerol-3-phosphate acyltransferase
MTTVVLAAAVGEILYSFSTWFWLAVPLAGFTWYIARNFMSIPVFVACIIAASLANLLIPKGPWGAFKSFWLWEYGRTHWVNFTIRGEGAEFMRNTMAGTHKRVMWATYPHGYLAVTSSLWWAGNPAFKRCRGAVHSGIFCLPIVGAMARWANAVNVSEAGIKSAFEDGDSVIICPGGVLDAANLGNVVKKRRGFLRIARELDVPVVPVWYPDCRQYYSQWLPLGRTMERWFKLPFPLFVWGKWWCPLMPRLPKESRIYVGEPIVLGIDDDYRYWDALEALQKQADSELEEQ